MLSELRSELITSIRNGFLATVEKVDKYRGEFTEGSNWNACGSACFIQVIRGWESFVTAADGSQLKVKSIFKIYAGANTRQDKDALAVAESVILFLNGSAITTGEGESLRRFKIRISPDGMDTIYFENDFEAYAFNIFII